MLSACITGPAHSMAPRSAVAPRTSLPAAAPASGGAARAESSEGEDMVVPEMPAERVSSNFLTGPFVESRGRLASIELPVTGNG